MEIRSLRVRSYKIIEAQEIVHCSNCQSNIEIGEKYIRLQFEIGKIHYIRPIFLHFSSQDCKKMRELKKEVQNDDAEIRLIISNERKVIIAKTTSSNEIITDREKTIELFKKGYKLETVCKGEGTAIAEAEILQEKAKLTAIAFFDDWFEIWAKDVWIDYSKQQNKWQTKKKS